MVHCHNLLHHLHHGWDGCSYRQDFHLVDIFRDPLKALPYHNDGRVLRQPEVVHCAMLDSDLLVSEHVHALTAGLVGVGSVADCVEVSDALRFRRAVSAAAAFSLFGTHAKIRTWAN